MSDLSVYHRKQIKVTNSCKTVEFVGTFFWNEQTLQYIFKVDHVNFLPTKHQIQMDDECISIEETDTIEVLE
jgi:hypothetical protein